MSEYEYEITDNRDFELSDLTTDELLRLLHEISDELERRVVDESESG